MNTDLVLLTDSARAELKKIATAPEHHDKVVRLIFAGWG